MRFILIPFTHIILQWEPTLLLHLVCLVQMEEWHSRKGSSEDQSIFVGYRSESGLTRLFPFYENLVNDAERFSQGDSQNEARNS